MSSVSQTFDVSIQDTDLLFDIRNNSFQKPASVPHRRDSGLFRESETKTRNIEHEIQKKPCREKLEELSLFGIRFGVYIKSSTRYVNDFALFSSITMTCIALWIIITNLSYINTVSNCCEVFHESREEKVIESYNVHIPTDRESWIDSYEFPKNESLLFPFVISVWNLTCEEFEINVYYG